MVKRTKESTFELFLENGMRRHLWLYIPVAIVLSACGSFGQAAEPTSVPAPSSAPIPTDDPNLFRAEPSAAPTEAPTEIVPTSTPIPTAEPAPTTIAPTVAAQPTTTLEPTLVPKPTTAAAKNPPPAAARAPTRLVIADIGLDYTPESVGLDRNRVPVVPDHDVGWYNLGAAPGQGDNVVFWGHVLRFRNARDTPAPFARMKELKVGASVVVYDAGGEPHNYTVTRTFWVTPDQVEVILPQGKEMVTMVSCIGEQVIQDGAVVDESHRLIVVAEPA